MGKVPFGTTSLRDVRQTTVTPAVLPASPFSGHTFILSTLDLYDGGGERKHRRTRERKHKNKEQMNVER
jgi:hypothetical protein